MASTTWTKLAASSSLRRSSQTLCVIGKTAYIYGGELRPREPVDSDVYQFTLSQDQIDQGGSVSRISPTSSPQPRVGSASTAFNGRLYVFSGRGGIAMAPIEENGSWWSFDPKDQAWHTIVPKNSQSPFPTGRSYHALANDGDDKIYLHSGCPEKGRLADLWVFTVTHREWQELPSAPAPARGGASIAFTNGKLWRMNGFDGTKEQGGKLDVFDPTANSWSSIAFPANGREGPAPRSVSCLLPLTVRGRKCLLTMLGESDPSNLGHQGAGKMLGDIWLFDISSQAWREVLVQGPDKPSPRGWFAADVLDESNILIQGGLSASNDRLDDLWLLQL
ncbi:uncharacterized protein A1O9_08802 [Exophiala aquamarina CBS 119918]|uniref:Kelch repeat protein n=1 Tax=Exophiala aquamarina CBS 119918 TaxID=1182545 RepID=A0A072P794_9EURO|nr:uncharacterized protein A1O9_08802 [Exophiala aquamarina CBS 119918]KEF55148.1 hypothetical protein A1O9_08802 [Exophiala aquamarina CBS 119918]